MKQSRVEKVEKPAKQEKTFEFLEHTADIKFKAYGKTINELFENCVLAFSNVISRNSKIQSGKGKVVNVSGADYESLLYNLIDELIFLLDKGFVVSKAAITVRGFNLRAELFGDDSSNYKDLDQVKAPTYAEIYVKKTNKGFECQMVLDV